MGTSMNDNLGGKLFRNDSETFYSTMNELKLEFNYINDDYDCPMLDYKDVLKLLKGIEDKKQEKDADLILQLKDIISRKDDLMLIY